MRRIPPLNALKAVESAARLSGVSAAARELGITQSAVSQRVRVVEEWLDCRLFDRRGSRLALTEEGDRLQARLRAAFELIESALADVGEGGLPVVTVSVLPTFATRWLIPRLAGFQALHPEIEVRLRTGERLPDFVRDGVDLAVCYGGTADCQPGRGLPRGVELVRLLRDDMFPVAAPSLAAGLHAPGDLVRHCLLTVPRPPRADDWPRWLAHAGCADLRPRATMRFENSAQAIEAAAAGLGVALAHRPFAMDDLAAGRLVAPFDLALDGADAYWVATLSARLDRRRVRVFRDWLLRMGADASPVTNGME